MFIKDYFKIKQNTSISEIFNLLILTLIIII
jgi:hypothetical protein